MVASAACLAESGQSATMLFTAASSFCLPISCPAACSKTMLQLNVSPRIQSNCLLCFFMLVLLEGSVVCLLSIAICCALRSSAILHCHNSLRPCSRGNRQLHNRRALLRQFA